MQSTKKCFVISPIGDEGSEIRKHADVVFDCIIQPACNDKFKVGHETYEAERGDHKTAPGKITDQIYEDILNSDLIVTVLTNNNPNVYYELAVAQAAAKPVILLLEKGFTPPFDIKDHRIIYYDFDPHSIFQGQYAESLSKAIMALESRRGRPVVPFAPELAPLGDPMQNIGDRFSSAEDEVLNIVSKANDYLRIMGFTLMGWTMNEHFIEGLGALAPDLPRGIQVLIVSSKNPSFKLAMKGDDQIRVATESANRAPETWRKVLDNLPVRQKEIRISENRNIGYQVVLNENEAVIVPYLVSRDTVRGPYVFAKRGSSYYETIQEEFRYRWGE